MAEKNAFIQRLVDLRLKKGVSARDMSLSLGQCSGAVRYHKKLCRIDSRPAMPN